MALVRGIDVNLMSLDALHVLVCHVNDIIINIRVCSEESLGSGLIHNNEFVWVPIWPGP
jgi:hypothetical protein